MTRYGENLRLLRNIIAFAMWALRASCCKNLPVASWTRRAPGSAVAGSLELVTVPLERHQAFADRAPLSLETLRTLRQ